MPENVVSFVYTMFAMGAVWGLLFTFAKGFVPAKEAQRLLIICAYVAVLFWFSPSPWLFFVGIFLLVMSAKRHPAALATGIFLLPLVPSSEAQFGTFIP
ncbi:MAG: hypothetical protein AAF788_05630, partial [Pseudomonadota bacterium]